MRRTGGAAFDLRLARWMDAEKIDGFVAWTPFKHPTLGDVEIGGFRPYALSNPPAAKIAELGKSHTEFVTYLSSIFPKVAIASTSVTSLGGGLYRIKAEIENGGFLPTSTAQGVRVALGEADDGAARRRSGRHRVRRRRRRTSSRRSPAPAGVRPTSGSSRASPGRTVTLKAVAQKGGTATATLTLK